MEPGKIRRPSFSRRIVLVRYPDNEDQSVIREGIKRKDDPQSHWPIRCGEIVHGTGKLNPINYSFM